MTLIRFKTGLKLQKTDCRPSLKHNIRFRSKLHHDKEILMPLVGTEQCNLTNPVPYHSNVEWIGLNNLNI